MSLFSKKEQKPKGPRHIEVWGHLVESSRAQHRMVLASSVIALCSVLGMTWAMATALHKPLIYYVDTEGRASFGGRLENADQPLEVEITYVAKEFLRRTLAHNSLTVERDLADAMNLMTGELQIAEERRFEEWKLEKGLTFAEYIRAANIRTELSFSVIEVEDHGGKQFSVKILGNIAMWPLDVGAEAEPKKKSFESHLALVRVSRSEEIPNGLLVSHQSIQYFDSENPAEELKGQKGLSEE